MSNPAKAKPASVYTAVRIPPDLLAKAKRRAEEDGRSLSNYIKNLIRCDLRIEETAPRYHAKLARKQRH
jgi:predicted HicB family RNase H-like nuclease